jgi:predicted nucleotidyltransferase/HEPN domain-containing protein
MRRSLNHLPAGKRRELAFVTEVLTSAFAEAISTRKAPDVTDGQILKIILFGSYARGDWVEDPVGRYFSDYDLLVVVDNEPLTDVLEIWEGAEKRLLSALSNGAQLRTPVNFIVHTLDDVNQQLARGRYFFVDIVRDGIALLNLEDHSFAQPQELGATTAVEEAENYREDWLPGAEKAQKGALFYQREGDMKESAFLLHQAVERLYNGLLLVLTLYTPKSHNLIRLRQLAQPLDPRLAEVWPTATKFEKRCFELLRAAYVKARYSRHYQITAEELDWISGRVENLKVLVQDICEARIAMLREQAAAGGS